MQPSVYITLCIKDKHTRSHTLIKLGFLRSSNVHAETRVRYINNKTHELEKRGVEELLLRTIFFHFIILYNNTPENKASFMSDVGRKRSNDCMSSAQLLFLAIVINFSKRLNGASLRSGKVENSLDLYKERF